jgi:hypothetical protein
MNTILDRFSTARRVRLHNEASVLFDHIRARYRAAVLAGGRGPHRPPGAAAGPLVCAGVETSPAHFLLSHPPR